MVQFCSELTDHPLLQSRGQFLSSHPSYFFTSLLPLSSNADYVLSLMDNYLFLEKKSPCFSEHVMSFFKSLFDFAVLQFQ